MHKRKANVCLIHPLRNKPGEGNAFVLSLCPLQGEAAFILFIYLFLSIQSHIKFPLCSFMDILEYFQVDGSVTSLPLVRVLVHLVFIFMIHSGVFLTTSALCSVKVREIWSSIQSSIHIPLSKTCEISSLLKSLIVTEALQSLHGCVLMP